MSYSTDKWFQYLNEDIRMLEEGLRDIGLPEQVIDFIESSLHSSSESAKTWMGHMWKKTYLHQFVRPSNRIQKFRFDTMEPLLSALDYYTGGAKEEDINPPLPKVEFESLLREGEEWTAEKSERTKFVLKNINNVLKDQALGKWPKAFKKALKNLSKMGLNNKTVEFVREVLQNATEQAWKQFHSRYRDTFVLLNLHPDNIRLLQKYDSMLSADNAAEQELREMEDPEKILHEFDDGSYWYDLDTSSCDIEGERMGHCGAGQSGGSLYSLRKPEGKRGKSKSFVTIEADSDTVYQIKGRENSAPPEGTWDHIAWFINNMGIDQVTEQGEYSSEPENFEEMNFWLSNHTNASFSGGREARLEQVRSELENADYEFQGMEFCEVFWEISDYEGDGNDIYVELGSYCRLEINLGWPAFEQRGEGYFAMSAEGVTLDNIDYIPTRYSEVNDFESEVGLDDILSDLPGEDKEVNSIEVKMMEGVDPTWREGDPIKAMQQTAHLIIDLRLGETADEDSALSDFNYFASEVRDEFEEKYDQRVREVQMELADGGYMSKNAYLKNREDLLALEGELEHWSVASSASETIFTFQHESGTGSSIPGGASYFIPTGVSIPTEALIYLGPVNTANYEYLVRDIFKARDYRHISSPSLNRQMAMHLDDAHVKAQQKSRDDSAQTQFDFGPAYEPEDYLEFPEDLNFVIKPKIRYDPREPNKVPSVTFDMFFQIKINYSDSIEEIDGALNLVKYLNENPELVLEAGKSIISIALEPVADEVAKKRQSLQDNELANQFFRGMDGVYGAAADSGSDDDAERRMLIAMWIRDSWPDMDLLQRFVTWSHYIDPMNKKTFRLHGNLGAIDPDTGKPRMWDDLIQRERLRRGVGLATSDSTSAPAGTVWQEETIEEQVHRIAAMLGEVDKSYDLRIYKITVGCNVSDELGGSEAETAAEIRGIEGVTTVRPLADLKKRISPQSEYIPFELKFELVGAQSRVAYRDRVLFPGMRRIKGVNIVDWTSIHRTNVQGTVRTVRENRQLSEYGFGAGTGANIGGLAQNLASVRYTNSPGRQAPPDPFQSIVDDWAQSSIMAYDYPTNTNDMRYHVMMPVEQLWKYRSRYSRHPLDVFDAKHQQFDAVYQRLKDQLEDPEAYHDFIQNGAQGPVYVAIGKNGRVKITGNEDLIWFAKRSGLKEVPVFLSYQRQV